MATGTYQSLTSEGPPGIQGDEDDMDEITSHREDEDVDLSETSSLLPQSRANRREGATASMDSSSGVSYKAQYFTAACATLGAMSMGTIIGYSSPAGAILTNSTDPNINLDDIQNGWFSSTMSLGALVGGPAGGYCINTFGRRGTMILTIIPHIIGWVLLAAAQNFAMLVLGRIITGFSAGMVSLAVPTYIGELSSPKIRGFLGSCFQLLVTVGILYAFAMGAAFDSFRWIAGVCLIIPILFSISMVVAKESPVYLLAKGRDDDACQALQHFRGANCNISAELKVLKDTLEMNQQKKASFRDLKASYVLKPLFISLGLMFFQQFSGINAVLFNLQLIFESAGTSISGILSSIIVGIMQVVATVVSAVLSDKAGRKLLLLVSTASMAASLIVLGVYFYLKEHAGTDMEKLETVASLGWLPLVCLIVFIVGFSLGYGPIPWLMIGELFSSDIREVAGSIATSTNWTLAFITTIIFNPIRLSINDSGIYWMFAAFNILSFFFVMIFVYETKGKSIEEITAHFGGKVATSKTETKKPTFEIDA